jgi:hypothetical protein
MNPRLVLALGFVALIVLTLALMLGRDLGAPSDEVDAPLVPELRDQVNDIEAIDIVGPDGEPVATLRRERERWRVREKSDYEADFGLVHDLLRDLAMARRADERTSNPDWYVRLGVADPGTEGNEGVLVRFPGTGLPAVILGRPDSAGVGRFARIQGESPSWLTDRSPDIPLSTLEWLERAVMDIPADELEEVTIRHADGETVRLRSTGDERGQWVLLNVPEGREASPEWQLRPVAGALARLSMRDVRPHQSVPDNAVRVLYRTVDGLNFLASVFEDDDRHWVHFSVSAEVEAIDEDDPDDEQTELAIDAAAVDGRLSPWQFAIGQSRYDNMTRRVDDLLSDVES